MTHTRVRSPKHYSTDTGLFKSKVLVVNGTMSIDNINREPDRRYSASRQDLPPEENKQPSKSSRCCLTRCFRRR